MVIVKGRFTDIIDVRHSKSHNTKTRVNIFIKYKKYDRENRKTNKFSQQIKRI